MKRTTVVKLGGSSLPEIEQLFNFLEPSETEQFVLVHGGGPQLSAMLARLGHRPTFSQGQRVTDEETLEVAHMILAGSVNKRLVSSALARGHRAVGLSGLDGAMLKASPYQQGALGRVGVIEEVDTDLLRGLLQAGFLPILCSLALAPDGGSYNVNADAVAAAVAVALEAERLVYLTNVDGLLDREGRTMPIVTSGDLPNLLAEEVIVEGMIPKLESALAAVRGGVSRVEIRKAGLGSGTIVKGGLGV